MRWLMDLKRIFRQRIASDTASLYLSDDNVFINSTIAIILIISIPVE